MNMSVHDQLMKNMQEVVQKFSAAGINLQLPPASSLTLGTHYIELEYGKVLAACLCQQRSCGDN